MTATTASMPAWVPALFAGLMFLGYRLSQPQAVKPGKLVGVAVGMFGFSVYGLLSTFGPAPLAVLWWAAAYAVAVVLGARYVAAQGLRTVGERVQMPGSWLPLVLMLGIFAVKAVLSVATGTRWPGLQDAAFIAGMSGLLGALSGGFAARAVAVSRHRARTVRLA